MGLFSNLTKDIELEKEKKMQNEAMKFNREQNIHTHSIPEDNTEYLERENRSDLIKWQQELDPELDSIAYRLTGWKRVDGRWFSTEKTPLCNEEFMNDVVAPQLEPWLSKNLINSNLNENRILMDLQMTSDEIAESEEQILTS